MAKYDKKAQEEVGKALHEQKHEHTYKNRKQAIAVGLSKARKKGSKAPEKSDKKQ
jgi:hypothetical protein